MVAVAVCGGHERAIVNDRKAGEIDRVVGSRGVDGGVVVDDTVGAAVRRSGIILEIIEGVHRCRSSVSLAVAMTTHITVIYFPRLLCNPNITLHILVTKPVHPRRGC